MASLRAHVEIADQWPVIRQPHVRNLEVRDLDALADQHEIQLRARRLGGIGGQALRIGAAQARRAHEQVQLVRAPEGVEVAGDDDRLGRLLDQFVQVAQLVLAVAVLDRQVHEEDAHLVQFQLDDQPLDARNRSSGTARHARAARPGRHWPACARWAGSGSPTPRRTCTRRSRSARGCRRCARPG